MQTTTWGMEILYRLLNFPPELYRVCSGPQNEGPLMHFLTISQIKIFPVCSGPQNEGPLMHFLTISEKIVTFYLFLWKQTIDKNWYFRWTAWFYYINMFHATSCCTLVKMAFWEKWLLFIRYMSKFYHLRAKFSTFDWFIRLWIRMMRFYSLPIWDKW